MYTGQYQTHTSDDVKTVFVKSDFTLQTDEDQVRFQRTGSEVEPSEGMLDSFPSCVKLLT